MVAKTCKVCEKSPSKYKCPTCLIPYCSLTCFKKHKVLGKCFEIGVEPWNFPSYLSAPVPVVHVESPYYVDNPSEVLQQAQLENIVSSSEIRDAVKNEELQKLIYQIASASDAEHELDKAMEVDSFRIFTEKILSTISSKNE